MQGFDLRMKFSPLVVNYEVYPLERGTMTDKDLCSRLKSLEKSLISGNLQIGLDIIRELMNEFNTLQGNEKLKLENKLEGEELSTPSQLLSKNKIRLKIYTLGRFSMVLDNQPIVFIGKAKKRPLDLLKAMIALGGRYVPKSHLTELLWPDSAGDASVSVMNTTLSRLRKIIGKKAISTDNGRLSLNSDYCWVDSWGFERILNRGKNPELVTKEMVASLINQYQGTYMVGDEEIWLLIKREKLQNKLLYILSRYAKDLKLEGNFTQAIYIYEQCISIDNLCEEYYFNVMHCQTLQKLIPEAIKTYNRCHKSLTTQLDVLPSQQCKELYELITK